MLDVGILFDFKKRLTDYEDEMRQAAERYRPKFRELIKQYSKELWGFKEASMIFYLPYLYDEFENPMYIHLIRDYESTANSLLDMVTSKNWRPEYHEKIKFFTRRRRLKLYLRIIRLLITGRKYRNTEFFMKIVTDSHNRIENFLQNTKHLTIHLNELTANSEDTINKIIQDIDRNILNMIEFYSDALKSLLEGQTSLDMIPLGNRKRFIESGVVRRFGSRYEITDVCELLLRRTHSLV